MFLLPFQEQLDQKLQQRQARETGICQVRRELYAQCFDELIRQCTINCTERGLLMLRVRFVLFPVGSRGEQKKKGEIMLTEMNKTLLLVQ